MLKIKFGSVFDDKCDLLILPCNDQGGATGWVRHEIEQHHLPFWKQNIPHGEVLFSPVQTLYEKADYVSVTTSRASLDAIARITQRIGLRRDNDGSQVNLPLLGVGAGGLENANAIKIASPMVLFGKLWAMLFSLHRVHSSAPCASFSPSAIITPPAARSTQVLPRR